MDKEQLQRILIIDDIPDNLQLLSKMLSKTGYAISYAVSGKQALEVLKTLDVDLVLLDISMPEMDGYEVCKRIKSNPKTSNIPVIFVTALKETGSLVKGFEVGGEDYITKPFNIKELTARIQMHLKLKNQTKKIIEQNKAINDSITYAKAIQNTLLPTNNKIKQVFKDSFILYKPQHIIGGDFYYVYVKNQYRIAVVADCSGHGIPGAIITMHAITLLKGIVENQHELNPAKILELLDKEMLGMNKGEDDIALIYGSSADIAIACINTYTNQITYAGAKRPLILIRDNQLVEYKGSPFSVGDYYSDKPKTFKTKEFYLRNNDMLYMYSDGYADQFGGLNDKKYTHKKLKEFLLNISDNTIENQYKMLSDEFKNWLNKTPQIDDVCVFGIQYFENKKQSNILQF